MCIRDRSYAPAQPHPDGEDETWVGEEVEVFSDGSVQVPRGKHMLITRRAGYGAAWGEHHTKNFSLPMLGPCQTIGRAELAAVEEVTLREQRPVRIRVDNAWVVGGMQILLAGHPPDPLWEHLDIWVRIWDALQTRTTPVRVQKVKGHLDDALIAEGKGTEEERKGNDLADDKAKEGVRAHHRIWEAKEACASLRNLALKTHRMMAEIVLARAAVLKERQLGSGSATHTQVLSLIHI